MGVFCWSALFEVAPVPPRQQYILLRGGRRRAGITMLGPASDLISGRPAEKHIYGEEAELAGLLVAEIQLG